MNYETSLKITITLWIQVRCSDLVFNKEACYFDKTENDRNAVTPLFPKLFTCLPVPSTFFHETKNLSTPNSFCSSHSSSLWVTPANQSYSRSAAPDLKRLHRISAEHARCITTRLMYVRPSLTRVYSKQTRRESYTAHSNGPICHLL